MISISFINFNLNIGTENDIKKEHKCFILSDINNPNLKLEAVQIHFVEIKRFTDILKNISVNDYNNNKLMGGNNIMSKVVDKYKRFIADEKEMSAYNERDAFLYGQAVILQYKREEGRKEGRE